MKSIQLFHSYNYVNEKFIHNNKNLYDKNNKLIFSLLNIPDNSDVYTIEIQRILKKKIYSKKKNNKSFYTKHNIKVFLLVNYNRLQYYIKQNIPILQFNLLYKIILSNLKVSKNEYIHNIICINKAFNKKISMKNIILNNFNFFSLNDYYLDILNKKIIDKKNLILTKYIVNGCIIYYDLLKSLIDEIITIKNTIFIGNESQKIYGNIITNLDTIDINNIYDTIILLDTSIDISSIKYNKIIVCINKTDNIKVNNVILLLNKYFSINLYKYELTNKLIYNILNICVFRNYSQKLIKVTNINIHENEYINIKNFKIVDNEILTKLCNICFNNNINIETICNHYFCSSCIIKLLNKTKLICPYCRLTNTLNTLTYLVKSKNDILNDKTNINNKYKYLIKKSMKNEISIIYNDDNKINSLRNLYKFMNFKPYIYNSYNIETINKNNIYFLDNIDKYDINNISNTLIKNGLKKINFNFLG
jgi:hypothetical protein